MTNGQNTKRTTGGKRLPVPISPASPRLLKEEWICILLFAAASFRGNFSITYAYRVKEASFTPLKNFMDEASSFWRLTSGVL